METSKYVFSAICDLLFWPNGKIINVKECANNNHLQVNKTSAFIRQTFALENIPLDCLFHIYQYLTPVDVAKVSEASIALNNFAKENNIYKKFSDFGIFCSGIWNIEEFKCIVRYFGDNFKQITIDSDRINGDSVENLAFILRHCPNLEELRVKNVKLRQQAVNVLREEPCSFTHLFIQSSGRDIHLRNVLAMWSQITYLTIHCIGINQHPLQLVGDVHALERLSLANATINSNHFTLFLQKHVQSLRYLSLVNIKWTSESFYKSLNTMLPHLEQLQISVTSFYDSLYISGMHLKYLQLVGTSKVMLYPMTDLPQLEELDLVQMHGANCFVAAGLPNLRVLSINDSIINQFDGLIDVIESLPNLQRLILRRCYFWPDDIIYLFETNINLTEIELELPMMDATIYLLQSLAEIANERNTNGNEFHLRIIVYKIEVSNRCYKTYTIN